jgi:hypothetical protein
MVKLAIDTVKKADIEYIQEVLNSHEDKLCQRGLRVLILVTKTLHDIRYQKAFTSVQTL